MKHDLITIVGRAHSLAFSEGTASWKIAIRRSAELTVTRLKLLGKAQEVEA